MKQSKILTALGLSSLDIQNMLMNGYTMPEIAKKYNITYISLVQAFKIQKKDFKYIDYIQPKEEVKDIKNVSFTFDKPIARASYHRGVRTTTKYTHSRDRVRMRITDGCKHSTSRQVPEFETAIQTPARKVVFIHESNTVDSNLVPS